ncbi:MAG: hypothetical protein GX539_13665, partial [Candidatus Cloacimonetes bacterium]|nr:hypothetical protein [Candidatus Cloacimonadota bacterium]
MGQLRTESIDRPTTRRGADPSSGAGRRATAGRGIRGDRAVGVRPEPSARARGRHLVDDGPLTSDLGGHLAYPGSGLDGLYYGSNGHETGEEPTRPNPNPIKLVLRSQSYAPGANCNVIAAYIVPRMMGRPVTFQMQRNLQLARALKLMINEPTTSPLFPPGLDALPADPGPDRDPAVLITGGSFGGLTSQLAVTIHPEVFDGASAAAFSGSMERQFGEQISYNFLSALSGFRGSDTAYRIADTLEISGWLRDYAMDFFSASTTTRLRHGHVQRPLSFLVGDEDTVTNGTDWMPLLTDTRAYVPNAVSMAYGMPIATMVIDRRCHASGYFTTPILGKSTDSVVDPAIEMLMPAHLARLWPITSFPLAIPRDNTEAAHDHALARGLFTPAPVSPTDRLQLDASFGTAGRSVASGVALGQDESLKARDGVIWVGSAEGVVTRFELDATSKELVAVQSSTGLGFGAWALDVGELDDGHAGPEVAVATYRHLYVLDGTTLAVIAGPLLLPYECSGPRRLQIAEVFANIADSDIVFTSMLGQLVAVEYQAGSQGLSILSNYGEPGIQDFIVHSGLQTHPGTETESRVPISLMSVRGHIANVTLDRQSDPTLHHARLHAWTDPIIGEPKDLEVYQDDGVEWLAALYELDKEAFTPGIPAIRIYDPLTLQLTGTIVPSVTGSNPRDFYEADAPRVFDMTPIRSIDGVVYFAVVNETAVFLIDAATGATAMKKLGGFGPAYGALAITTVDFPEEHGGDFDEELVISSASGHVTWF